MIMPFGRHRGKPLEEIPADYLEWILDNCTNLTPRLRSAIGRTLGNAESPSTGVAIPTLANAWYRKLSLEFHPDRGGSHDAMKAVNRGRELLLQMAGVE